MFSCGPPCAARQRLALDKPKALLVSSSPNAAFEPLLAALAQHNAVSLLDMRKPLPSAAPVVTSRVRHVMDVSLLAARSGLLPVVVLPRDPWFALTGQLAAHLGRHGVAAVHAHVFAPFEQSVHTPADAADFGIMYRATAGKAAPTPAKFSHAAAAKLVQKLLDHHPHATELAGFLGEAIAAGNAKVHPRFPADVTVLAAHAGAGANAMLAALARAAVPTAPAPRVPSLPGAPLSREWLHAAAHALRGTDLAGRPQQTNPPVHLLTYLSKNYKETGHGAFWERSAQKFGWDYTVLGTDSDWPGLGEKIRRYHDFLQATPYADTDIVVVTDSDDVVLNTTPDELLQRYNAVRDGKDLVVSTEWDHIWPNRIVMPGREQERYPSINVGLFCGTKRALLDLYSWELSGWFNEDQIRFKEYIDSNGENKFTIDYHHQLFSCMREDYEADMRVNDAGVIENTVFHTVPSAVHFPGPMGKSLFKKVQPDLHAKGGL